MPACDRPVTCITRWRIAWRWQSAPAVQWYFFTHAAILPLWILGIYAHGLETTVTLYPMALLTLQPVAALWHWKRTRYPFEGLRDALLQLAALAIVMVHLIAGCTMRWTATDAFLINAMHSTLVFLTVGIYLCAPDANVFCFIEKWREKQTESDPFEPDSIELEDGGVAGGQEA